MLFVISLVQQFLHVQGRRYKYLSVGYLSIFIIYPRGQAVDFHTREKAYFWYMYTGKTRSLEHIS